MNSSSSEDFDLFVAIYDSPDLLELVVQQCHGNKNGLRLACSRLRDAVDACVTRLAWKNATWNGPDTIASFVDFYGANGAKNMAVFALCPRLQTLDFKKCRVADLSPLAACVGLRRVTRICVNGDMAPCAALTRLEHLDCSESQGLNDISALAACTALKYLECSHTRIRQLPLRLPSLETLICCQSPLLTDISALVSYKSLKLLDCTGCGINGHSSSARQP